MIRLRVFLHRNPEFDNSAALLFVHGKKVQLRQLVRALRLCESPFSHVVILSVNQENGRDCYLNPVTFSRRSVLCSFKNLRVLSGEFFSVAFVANLAHGEQSRSKNPKITFQSRPEIPAAPSPARSRGPWGLEHRRNRP